MIRHTKDRDHYCRDPNCENSINGSKGGFKRRSELVRHCKVKHEELKYNCPWCKKEYPRPDNLQRHVKSAHPGKQEEDDQKLIKALEKWGKRRKGRPGIGSYNSQSKK
jgi:hypothetical protein